MSKAKKNKNKEEYMPIDYEGMKCLGHFSSDVQQLKGWIEAIFRGGIKKDDPMLISLKEAIYKGCDQMESNIKNMRKIVKKCFDETEV